MNVEICSESQIPAQVCLKGHDRATVEISNKSTSTHVDDNVPKDEIQPYFDGRYICGVEAAYHTFGFDVHY